MAALTIASKFSRLADKNVDELGLKQRQKSDNYRRLYNELRKLASGVLGISSPIPYAGGISISDMQNYEADTDRVKPAFNRGMHDNGDTSTAMQSLTDLD